MTSFLASSAFTSHGIGHQCHGFFMSKHLVEKEYFMAFLLIRHKVKDFKTWKSGYDGHLPKRIEAGLTDKYIFQNTEDPNEVTLLFETQDLTRAKAFTASTDLRERMQELGVIGKPDIYFLKN
jgi:hypothetical protein